MRITEHQLRQIIREELNEARFAPMGSLKVNPYYPPRRSATGVSIQNVEYNEVYNDPGSQQWEAVGTAMVRGREVPFTATFVSFLTEPEQIVRSIASAIGDASGMHVSPAAVSPDLDGNIDALLSSQSESESAYQSMSTDSEW